MTSETTPRLVMEQEYVYVFFLRQLEHVSECIYSAHRLSLAARLVNGVLTC